MSTSNLNFPLKVAQDEPSNERKRGATKDQNSSPKKRKTKLIDIDLPDAPTNGKIGSLSISFGFYILLVAWLVTIRSATWQDLLIDFHS